MSELDLGALMRQAQQLREQMEYMQQGLAAQTVEGTAGAGMVKVIATGDLKIARIDIDPQVAGEDREMLQDLIVAATNNALDKARALAQEKMGSILPTGMFPGGVPGRSKKCREPLR
jgi:DNA-binding YbaB/EbfC family protein